MRRFCARAYENARGFCSPLSAALYKAALSQVSLSFKKGLTAGKSLIPLFFVVGFSAFFGFVNGGYIRRIDIFQIFLFFQFLLRFRQNRDRFVFLVKNGYFSSPKDIQIFYKQRCFKGHVHYIDGYTLRNIGREAFDIQFVQRLGQYRRL